MLYVQFFASDVVWKLIGWFSFKVVEELLSKSGSMGLEAARAIADAAMLEVASTNVPNMVTQNSEIKDVKTNFHGTCRNITVSSPPQAPDEFYEGITFEHFEQVCTFPASFSSQIKLQEPFVELTVCATSFFVTCLTDSKRAWDGVQDAHSLFGCRHFDDALWEIKLVKKLFMWSNDYVAAVKQETPLSWHGLKTNILHMHSNIF